MKKINIAEISEYLRENESVSIPSLMKRFYLRYDAAKYLMNSIIERGWALEDVNGVEYKVLQEHLNLKKLEKHDIKDIYEEFDNDCATVVDYLMSHYCATYFDLLKAVRGDDDTKAAILYLKQKGIIYEHNRKYFLNIDKKSSESLIRFAKEKLRRTRHHRNSEISIEEEMEKMFNEIFDDDETDGTN